MFLHAEARLLKGSLRQCLTTHSTSKKPPVRFLPHFARVPIDLFLSTLSRVLKHFSSQTRSARRQRRARQAALQSAIASLRGAVKSAVAATPEGARKAGPWAISAAANIILFALLFLYGVPRFVADTSEAIQVTVTSFFAETPPPQKPDENAGGGGGQKALEAAAASYQVASATAATMSLAAVTTVNPSALQINIPQADATDATAGIAAKIATVNAAAKAAPTAGTGGGIGGGNGSGAGNGTGNGRRAGAGAGAEPSTGANNVAANKHAPKESAEDQSVTILVSNAGLLARKSPASRSKRSAIYWETRFLDLKDAQRMLAARSRTEIAEFVKNRHRHVRSDQDNPNPIGLIFTLPVSFRNVVAVIWVVDASSEIDATTLDQIKEHMRVYLYTQTKEHIRIYPIQLHIKAYGWNGTDDETLKGLEELVQQNGGSLQRLDSPTNSLTHTENGTI